MDIVASTRDEHVGMAEVWEASVRATHGFLSEADIQFFKPLIVSDFLPAVELYCLKDGLGKIHGFLGVAGRKIEMLFIAPQSMGKGLGRMLVRFAVDELGVGEVDVNEQNPSAVGFYQHLGFKVVGRSPVDGMGKPFPLLHMKI